MVRAQDAPAEKTPAETTTPEFETVTREQVEALRTRIENAADLTPEVKKTALDLVQNALISLAAVTELNQGEEQAKTDLAGVDKKRADLQAKLDAKEKQNGFRQEIAELKAELQSYLSSLREKTGSRESNVEQFLQYEQTLATKKNELVQAQTDLDSIEAYINGRTERQRIRNERIKAIPAEKENIQQQIDLLPATTDDLTSKAKKYSLQAELQRLELEPVTVQAEIALSNTQEAATISQLDRQIKSLVLEQRKQEVQLYTETLTRAREIDASNRKLDAQKKLESAKQSKNLWEQLLVEIYEKNVSIINEELEVQTNLKEIRNDLEQVSKERASLSEEFEQIKTRSGRTGSSRAFGIRLRQQRNTLRDAKVLRYQAYQDMLPYEAAQLKYFDTRDARKPLDDIEEEIEELLHKVISDPNNEDESGLELSDEENSALKKRYQQIENRYREAFSQQREYLSQVITAYDKYLQELENYEIEQLQLADLSEQVADYIDERVLWIRSNDPISFKQITADVQSLSILTDKTKWQLILKSLSLDLWRHLFVYGLFFVIWVFLFATQARQTARIKQTSKKAASRLNTSLKPTIQSLLMTVSKSCVLPLPILFFSWRLIEGTSYFNQEESTTANLLALALNFRSVGITLFALEFIRNVHRPQGLAQSHFNWPETACKIVSYQVRSFILLITPLLVLIAILDSWKSEGDSEVLSQVFSIGMYLLLAYTLHRLTDNENGAISPWVQQNRNGWVDRFATLLYLSAILIPISFAVLTGIGFSYTVTQLATKLSFTVVLLFGVLFVRSFLFRWLNLRHRRMAVEQAREARAAIAKEEKSSTGPAKAIQHDAQEQKVVLAELSAQTKRLLNTTIVVLSLIGIWFIWTDVLPALHYFDEIALPGTTIRIPAIFSAIVIAILTATASRNIPGLLQITLLEWLPLQKSSRYAIAAVTQYIIAIVGLLAISGTLNIGWDQVQWLAAALTFGLGFGLQEIFANFVSGLIILLEQPVRVGDVVTIDGVSGSVSRIRIRSTTITDWDRKEYIVPNKEFITGKLLNWTLTDTTNRFSIVVGVAYGTDPQQVHQILTNVVQQHHSILKDPEPVITFDQFGDSSLNFTVRAFLPVLDGRLQVIHELHIAINKALADANIEIPFPQRDLHLRSAVNLPIISDPAINEPEVEATTETEVE